MAYHRSRSRGVGARIIRRRKSLTPICHCSRDRSISLTPITNPSQFLRPATSVPSQIYPMRLRISPWLWFRTKCAPARNRRSQSAMGRAAGFAWCRPTPSWWTSFAQCHTVAQATKFSRARRQATVHQDRGPVDLRGDHESVIAGGRYGNRRQRASQLLAAARRERQWQTSVLRKRFGHCTYSRAAAVTILALGLGTCCAHRGPLEVAVHCVLHPRID